MIRPLGLITLSLATALAAAIPPPVHARNGQVTFTESTVAGCEWLESIGLLEFISLPSCLPGDSAPNLAAEAAAPYFSFDDGLLALHTVEVVGYGSVGATLELLDVSTLTFGGHGDVYAPMTPSSPVATLNVQTGVLEIPGVVVEGYGTFDVEMTLTSVDPVNFVVTSATPSAQ